MGNLAAFLFGVILTILAIGGILGWWQALANQVLAIINWVQALGRIFNGFPSIGR